jgi:hypothetical protein
VRTGIYSEYLWQLLLFLLVMQGRNANTKRPSNRADVGSPNWSVGGIRVAKATARLTSTGRIDARPAIRCLASNLPARSRRSGNRLHREGNAAESREISHGSSSRRARRECPRGDVGSHHHCGVRQLEHIKTLANQFTMCLHFIQVQTIKGVYYVAV